MAVTNPEDWMKKIAAAIEAEWHVDHYDFACEVVSTMCIAVRLHGGEGDTSTWKRARPALEEIVNREAKAMSKLLTASMMARNVGDDLVVVIDFDIKV